MVGNKKDTSWTLSQERTINKLCNTNSAQNVAPPLKSVTINDCPTNLNTSANPLSPLSLLHNLLRALKEQQRIFLNNIQKNKFHIFFSKSLLSERMVFFRFVRSSGIYMLVPIKVWLYWVFGFAQCSEREYEKLSNMKWTNAKLPNLRFQWNVNSPKWSHLKR